MKLQNLVSTRIVGYCPWSQERIISEFNSGTSISSFPGDFIFIAEGKDSDNQPYTVLLTSIVSAQPYFFLVDTGRFFHGETIFDIIRDSGIKWEWNARAVNCLAMLNHLIADDSLHRRIKRIGASSIYYFSNQELVVKSDLDDFYQHHTSKCEVSENEAISILHSIAEELFDSKEIAISLSAGYDSRVILALAIYHGCRPIVGTMGQDDSTDVHIAKAISKRFDLKHNVIDLSEADYYESANEIIRKTSGTKQILDWHTYLFAKNIGYPNKCLHLVGTNGECIHSYFFDKGILSRLADYGPDALVSALWHRKYGLRRQLPGYRIDKFFQPDDSFCANKVPDLCTELCSNVPGFLNKMDWFLTYGRTRTFNGNGLTLYRSFHQTTSPFLDSRFVACGLRLNRSIKLNRRLFRELISRCVPELLDFPIDDSSISMRDREQPFYWLRKKTEKGYSPVPNMLMTDSMKEVIIESSDLDMFLPRDVRMKLFDGQETLFLSFLVTMHFLLEFMKEEDRSNKVR